MESSLKAEFKVLSIFGTRPEAVKMAPIIQELKRRNVTHSVVVTGQHREMLDQVTSLFNIKPDYDLNIMTASQTLGEITSRALTGLQEVIRKEGPSLVLVQGDTTSAFCGALAAFYEQVPVGHVEAGLRTDTKYDPYPEEMNRRLITRLSDLHFAATPKAAANLESEGIDKSTIFITGNPVIDALLWVADLKHELKNETLKKLDLKHNKVILITTHRRENIGPRMEAIFSAVKQLASHDKASFDIVFPVHLNPAVRNHALKALGGVPNVHLVDPLEYGDLAKVMSLAYIILTDSGGIQEEAPALGKPVLVMRATTERPEGIEAGTALLVGTEESNILNAAKRLIDDKAAHTRMAKAVNPYGDGTAAQKIVKILINYASKN